MHLAARACSAEAMRIQYCFVVAQASDASETKLAEVGEIELSANQPADFGHTNVLTKRYDAHLVVRWERGEMECGLLPQ